jgi:hypothetical protein
MEASPITAETHARLMQIERRIVDGDGLPSLRQWVQDTFQLSGTRARELVRQACERTASDWEFERPQLLATRLTQLEALAQKAIETNQLAVALGCWKHADQLVGLSVLDLARVRAAERR